MWYKCMIILILMKISTLLNQGKKKVRYFGKRLMLILFFVFIVARLIGLLSRFVFLRHCCGPCCGPYCGHC